MAGTRQAGGEEAGRRVRQRIGEQGLLELVLQRHPVGADLVAEQVFHERREGGEPVGQAGEVGQVGQAAQHLLPVYIRVRPQPASLPAEPLGKLGLLAGGAGPKRGHERLRKVHRGELFHEVRIVGPVHHPEGGDEVPDDRVIRQGAPGGQLAGNPRFHQPGFEEVAGLVPAVEQRHLAPGMAVFGPVPFQVGDEPAGLLLLIGEAPGADLPRGLPQRPEVLVVLPRVAGDQPAGGIEDLPGTAPVLVQDDTAGDPVVVDEGGEHRRVGPGEAEDGLLVVADHEDVPVVAGQAGEHPVLGRGEVLGLVNQQVVPAGGDAGGGRLTGAKQHLGAGDEVVEVEQVALGQVGAVALVDRGEPVAQRLPGQPVPAEPGEGPLLAFLVEAGPPEGLELVFLVGDAEALGDPCLLAVLPQELHAERVDGAAGDGLGPVAEGGGQPAGDLAGCPVGEGDRHDARRLEAALFHQMADALDEAEGLPRPGPGQHQHRAERRGDGFRLGG